jgi:hypothetical protein
MTMTIETTNSPPCNAGSKRPETLALAAYDPATAAQPAKRKKPSKISANAGALVPFMAAPAPIDAVPLASAAPSRAEPPCLRAGLLRQLGFRDDMEVHFFGEKTVTATDLDTQQNRFRLPNDGVLRHLKGMLNDAERNGADLLHEGPRPPKQRPVQGELQGRVRAKKNGKKHVGLPVVVVDVDGRKKELKLTEWESSRSTVINGDGYLNFIRGCSFREDEVVEIWAFRQKRVRILGVDVCEESALHILIAKKEQQLAA